MKVLTANCKTFRQNRLCAYILVALSLSCSAFAQHNSIKRAPANFVPDDDLIIVPMVIERNFMEDFNEKHKNDFSSARKKLQHWQVQEQYARDYGLEDSGFIQTPSEEEKQNFLQRHYLRYISKDVERANNKTLQTWSEGWSANDEIDSIADAEKRNDYIIKAKRKSGKKTFSSEKSVKVGKKTFKIDFQVRPEIGMMKVRLKSSYINVRAWVGANGSQEINLDRRFKSTGTRAMMNYYIDQEKVLASVDQHLVKYWSMRLTHEKQLQDFSGFTQAGQSENNTLHVRFGMGF